jgi:flagellar basal-body rod protein FlgG
MIKALWTAATGMQAQQMNQDVVANNLANINTVGFKKSRAEFQDLMYQILLKSGVETSSGNQLPTGIEVGMGVKPVSVQKMFSQGDYQWIYL